MLLFQASLSQEGSYNKKRHSNRKLFCYYISKSHHNFIIIAVYCQEIRRKIDSKPYYLKAKYHDVVSVCHHAVIILAKFFYQFVILGLHFTEKTFIIEISVNEI